MEQTTESMRRLAEEWKRRDKRQIINIFLIFLAFLIYFRKWTRIIEFLELNL